MSDFDFAIQGEVIPAGLSVIEASAGTGKTYSISHLVPRLLLDGTVDRIENILLVTYTKAAAGELAERVRKVLEQLSQNTRVDEVDPESGINRLRALYPEDKIRSTVGQALLEIDRLNVSTIHSFCQRTIQSEGMLCGIPSVPEVMTDDRELIRDALHDFWEEHISTCPLASAIAVAWKWDAEDDLKFLKLALSVDSPVFDPAQDGIEIVKGRIRQLRQSFPVQMAIALADVLSLVRKWKAAAPSEPIRNKMIWTLRNLDQATEYDFASCLRLISKISTNIDSRSHASEIQKITDIASKIPNIRLFEKECDSLRWEYQILAYEVVKKSIEKNLRINRLITYDGLVLVVDKALSDPEHGHELSKRLRERYKVALIDESQDTDPRQFSIFKRIFLSEDGGPLNTGHSMVMIGDPKQAIYGFRGADVNTYLMGKGMAAQEFLLTKTFRAPAPVVKAINALFARDESFLKEGLGFKEGTSGIKGDIRLFTEGKAEDGRLEVWLDPGGHTNDKDRMEAIASDVASDVARILNQQGEFRADLMTPEKLEQFLKPGKTQAQEKEGVAGIKVEPRDFAILVRNHRQAAAVQQALSERLIPAIRLTQEDVFASDEAGELLRILKALDEPRRDGLRRSALSTRMLGHTDILLKRSDSEEGMLERFTRWRFVLDRKGIATALAEIDEEMEVSIRIASMPDGERRLTNLRQLISLIQSRLHLESGSFEHVLRWFAQEVAASEERIEVEERQLQLESDAHAVHIVTMHTAKGLEYPLVFCPFLWESKSYEGVKRLPLNGEQTAIMRSKDERVSRAELEESIRLAYVAITRAKVKAWIYAGDIHADPPATLMEASAVDWLFRKETPPLDEKTSEPLTFRAWKESVTGGGRDKRQREGLEQIVETGNSGDVILWKAPPSCSEMVWSQPPSNDANFSALAAPEIPRFWTLNSFSSLTREKHPHGSPEADSGISESDSGTILPGSNPFTMAPGGTAMGNLIHTLLEKWDFSEPREDTVKEHLKLFPLVSDKRAEEWEPVDGILGLMKELREARLPGLECPIRQACPEPEASEWHFHLPIRTALQPSAFAKVFEKHGMQQYAELLSSLSVDQITGYLHGFIDRIAMNGGSWGVIDWKTNRLGSGAGDYSQESLMQSAMSSHYLLQAHLYLVALRRRLGASSSLAGAWIVYLRGINGGTDQGILHVSPSGELLDDLSGIFDFNE